MKSNLSVRKAVPSDVPLIHSFVQSLAEYDGHLDRFILTEQQVAAMMFGNEKGLEGIIAESDGKPVGFGVFFHNFPTFSGRRGIFIEDLFVYPEFRGQGFGKAMLKHLAKLAEQRNCCRLEWWTLNWNTKSLEFYKRLGAVTKEECVIHVLDGDALKRLAT